MAMPDVITNERRRVVGDTKIEWADAVWNPVTGCSKVSPGCAHCYAEALSHRFGTTAKPWIDEHAAENVVLHPERLGTPLGWRKLRRVFVNSMSDLFHELVPDQFIADVFSVMAASPQHTFQILTKRPARMCSLLDGSFGVVVAESASALIMRDDRAPLLREPPRMLWPLPNVWLGTSVENQHWAGVRIPLLARIPAAVRFLSCEPLLGPVDLTGLLAGIDWVIIGGESGPKHRPMEIAWARTIVAQCRATGVPVFVKQLGGAWPGTALAELPEDLRVREWPRSAGKVR